MTVKNSFSTFIRNNGKRLIRFSERLTPTDPPNRFLQFFHPGHYYSPLPDPVYVDQRADRLFNDKVESIPGIDDNWPGQRQLLEDFKKYASDYRPASSVAQARAAGERYSTDNTFFSFLDAYFYYGMLRHYRPKRITEVGSGYTSALALDVSEKFLDPRPWFVFIEPFPERLHQLLHPDDFKRTTMHEKFVQDISPKVFEELTAGDFLFIDSSHVSKIGSDVNFLLLDILPRLAPGVIVHIHDVFWPFEYPKAWLDEGRSWNEIYLLRALLANTSRYRILLFNSQVAKQHPELIKELPSWVKAEYAQSIWLEVK